MNRFCIRSLSGRFRAENYIGRALAAYGCAIRAYRRLMKLAPRFFDSAVVDRETAERQRQRAQRQQWGPILDRVYGVPPSESTWMKDPDHLAPAIPESPQTCRAIELQLEQWSISLAAGGEAMALYRQRQPHALMSLTHIARLADIGFTLARLACGDDANIQEFPAA